MDLIVSKEGDVELESQHNLKEVYIELHRLPSNPLKVTRSGPSETVLERRRSRRVPSGTKVQPGLSNKGRSAAIPRDISPDEGNPWMGMTCTTVESDLQDQLPSFMILPDPCDYSEGYVVEESSLKDILEDKRSVQNFYPCLTCGSDLIYEEWIHHFRHHLTERPFGCPACSSYFKTEKRLHSHFIKHGKHDRSSERIIENTLTRSILSRKKKYSCEICNLEIFGHSEYKEHFKSHEDDLLELQLKCPLCPASFCKFGRLKRHIQTHEKSFPYRCDSCSKKFGRQDHFQSHVQNCLTTLKRFTCSDPCGINFAHQWEMTLHLLREHGVKTEWKCDCGKYFSRKLYLKRHLHRSSKRNKRQIIIKELHATRLSLDLV